MTRKTKQEIMLAIRAIIQGQIATAGDDEEKIDAVLSDCMIALAQVVADTFASNVDDPEEAYPLVALFGYDVSRRIGAYVGKGAMQ